MNEASHEGLLVEVHFLVNELQVSDFLKVVLLPRQFRRQLNLFCLFANFSGAPPPATRLFGRRLVKGGGQERRSRWLIGRRVLPRIALFELMEEL